MVRDRVTRDRAPAPEVARLPAPPAPQGRDTEGARDHPSREQFTCRRLTRGSLQFQLTLGLTPEFVRLYSVAARAPDRRTKASEILEELLGGGRGHRETVTRFKPSVAGLRQSDWLSVIGVGQKTRIQLTVGAGARGPRFQISEDQCVNELSSSNPRSSRTGDGTVPLDGAIPPFLPSTQPICVTEDDLAFFELRDKLLIQLGGFHGLLPKVNLVQRLVVKHLLPGYGGKVWGRRVPGAGSWNPPIRGLRSEEKRY